ncbi:Imm3 family immunity protein [Paenibacillus melissococcoides]|uniref:Imm3 family immunity protein n=1 Tax=Paenibacillus melissococcoides TaxID=2912268 RepID=A0ABN8U0R8_9BACL|nr:Imm3 family immunity protein [Paenibacillus melissococcoides]MEB9895684.1 Imm3 family immunity protein [Bacillus cereus]CAH8244572.1 Imm3 family immunity protein [Paenibacillus melissococcoides]CAH8708381.1 Imm3 family immunity protein [Paenibacillus melissococcoides]CAH8709089.1 Imm3 family immunity protein [Paenibacillus melissococcoides]
MKKSYEEYIAEIYECYEDYKKEDNFSTVESIARTLYDFEGLMSRSETEKAIILITYGQLIVSEQLRVLVSTRDSLLENLSYINFELIKQEQNLTTEQFNDLQSRYNDVLENIKRKPSDTCRFARWFYDEMINEVNQYFLRINSAALDAEKITTNLLSRFRRDCENTLSEKIIVYTSLGENLVKHNLTVPNEIVAEIKGFDVDDTKDQLLPEEKNQLKNQIKRLLESFNTN